MDYLPALNWQITVGVMGPSSVTGPLQNAVSAVDAEVSVERIKSVDNAYLEMADCVVVAAPLTNDEQSDTNESMGSIIERAVEAIHRTETTPVILMAPTEAPIVEALEHGITEYLPISVAEQSPATVIERVVVTVTETNVTDYCHIYDSVAEPLALHDPETGELIHANKQLCKVLGYDKAELCAMEVMDYTADIEGYDQATAMKIITSAAKDDEIEPVEWPLETSSGEQVWVEAKLTPVEIGGQKLVLSTATDVTDRRQQRRQLQEITEHISEVVYLARADLSEVLFVNDAYSEVFGQQPEQIYEDPLAVLEAVHPEDREAYRAELDAMSEYIRDGATEPYEFSHRLQVNDEIRWVEVTAAPCRGPNGTVDRVVGVVRDVTDVRQREREYEQIFHGVNDAIAVHDATTGEIVDVNDSYVELYGYDRDAILSKDMSHLSVQEEGYTDERAKELVTTVAESGENKTVEWKIETADGEHRMIESNLTIATTGGQRRVLSIIRDITERKRREREFEQIFNGVTDVIGVYDPETAELLDVNEPLCDLLGYDRETIIEMDPAEATATELGYDAKTIGEVIRRVATTGKPATEIKWALRTANGETVWLEVNATPAEIDGERRIITIARDITERHDREERLEVLSRVLRHNLRNSMDAVIGYATTIEEQSEQSQLQEHAQRIYDTADNLLQLSSKARSLEDALQKSNQGQPEAISNILKTVVNEARKQFDERRFSMSIDSVDNAPLKTDIFRVVIQEVVENAAKHGNTQVEVQAMPVPDKDEAVIKVANDGAEIPNQVLAPVESGTETQFEHNLGLGLWLINWGVRRLGGSVEFDCPEEGRTAVHLRIPTSRT